MKREFNENKSRSLTMRVGDKVKFTGCDDCQIKWGSNDDPRKTLIEGEIYEINNIEIHSWHTKISLVGHEGKFNSVSFEKI